MSVNPPKATEVLSGYDYEWTQEGVSINCRRLTMHSDELKGEITVTQKQLGFLHRGSFNFSGPSARDKLQKTLTTRYDGSIANFWADILEQVCYYTTEGFRRGEPMVDIDTAGEDIKPPEYLLYPFIIKNYPSIIFGEPSASKSLLAAVFCAMVSLPWIENPMGWPVPLNPLKVAYLDWETDKSTIEWTLKCIERGNELGLLSMKYRRCFLPLSRDVEKISEWLDDSKSDITIIDSLGLAAGGEASATEPAFEFGAAWRKLKTSSLILAHTSKNQNPTPSQNKTVFGSVFYTAFARNIWEVKKSQEPGAKEIDIALFHRKPPPFTGLKQPLGLHITFDKDVEISERTILSTCRPETVDEFLQKMGTQTQIESLLKEGKMSAAEVANEIGITDVNARMALKRLKDKGKIIKLPDGDWGLVARV
jgi:DNA-binding transcriptional ArsR family regulator